VDFIRKYLKMKQLVITTFFISFIWVACSQFQKTATNEYIESSGFSDGNTFRAVIKVEPETRTGSLIERRETAYLKSKTEIKQFALQQLINYALTVKCANENVPEIDSERMKKFVQNGYISDEYYDSDGSVNLIYSIKSGSLKNKIDTETCGKK
jgi:hypothetical protein